MRNTIILMGTMFLKTQVAYTFPPDPPRTIQDAVTKIVYYLESDRHHIAAISPDGMLLWVCAPTRLVWKGDWHIVQIEFCKRGDGKDYISVEIDESGMGGGWIDKKTGVFTDSGMVL
jgi:hypothetical protein